MQQRASLSRQKRSHRSVRQLDVRRICAGITTSCCSCAASHSTPPGPAARALPAQTPSHMRKFHRHFQQQLCSLWFWISLGSSFLQHWNQLEHKQHLSQLLHADKVCQNRNILVELTCLAAAFLAVLFSAAIFLIRLRLSAATPACSTSGIIAASPSFSGDFPAPPIVAVVKKPLEGPPVGPVGGGGMCMHETASSRSLTPPGDCAGDAAASRGSCLPLGGVRTMEAFACITMLVNICNSTELLFDTGVWVEQAAEPSR